jgi:integral membrane protein (TIGR01906 family)
MKTALTAARWLFILALPVLLITASLAIAFNSLWLYRYGFEKYDVGQTTGLEGAELDKAARGLISYFNSSGEYIDVTVIKDGRPMTLFNEREVIHLYDVKGLVWLNYRLLLVSGLYCAGFALWTLLAAAGRHRWQLALGAAGGGGLTLALIGLLGILMLVDFDAIFIQFHLLSFSNDFWLLDPATDYLIMLFPGGFWYDAALIVVGMSAFSALVLGGAGFWYLRRRGK